MPASAADIKHMQDAKRALDKANRDKSDQSRAFANRNAYHQGEATQRQYHQHREAAQRNARHDELMGNIRRDAIKKYFERASRSWEQGAYDPQGQFWMQFWDFIFNFFTEALLKAGYIDANKIATAEVDNMKSELQEATPRGLPPGSPVFLPRPRA